MVICGKQFKTVTSDTNLNKWELNILVGKLIKSIQPIYIALDKENKISGFIGCNILTGNFSIENEIQIKFNKY